MYFKYLVGLAVDDDQVSVACTEEDVNDDRSFHLRIYYSAFWTAFLNIECNKVIF